MYSIIKQWLEFRIYLPDLEAWLKALGGDNYKGLSADYALTMWFSEEPTEQQKTDIDAQWDGLSEEGETAKWTQYDNRNKAVEAAKLNLLTAAFDTLLPAERKLLLAMTLTDEDKDSLVTKFPQ